MTSEARPQHLWHPFADMEQVAGHELVIESGDGVWVTDAEGNRYLDDAYAAATDG